MNRYTGSWTKTVRRKAVQSLHDGFRKQVPAYLLRNCHPVSGGFGRSVIFTTNVNGKPPFQNNDAKRLGLMCQFFIAEIFKFLIDKT